MSLLRRIAGAWRRHGALGFAGLVGPNIKYYFQRLFRWSGTSKSEFDESHGTDTESIREIGSLDIESANARHAVRYQPSPHALANEIIQGLRVDHRRFHFIDFGAGKGRVLMIAGRLPFKEVIGVEFSRELQRIATENIAKTNPTDFAAPRIECVHGDVTEYPIPAAPLVCYFYNPFNREVMVKVVERLEASLVGRPREVVVIYLHPEHRDVFGESWRVEQEEDAFVVLKAGNGAAPSSSRK